MSIVRRLARPLLAAAFVREGVDAVLHPMPKADAVRAAVHAISEPLGIPEDAELYVRVNGGLMAAAGVLFALGRLPRLAAAALTLAILPSTYAEHAFWNEKDPERRRAARQRFLANLGLIGGALLATVDTEGRPGLAWRGRHASQHAGRRAKRDARLALKAAHDVLPG